MLLPFRVSGLPQLGFKTEDETNRETKTPVVGGGESQTPAFPPNCVNFSG